MKWFIALLFVLAFVAGYQPQLSTRYTPVPALRRVRRKVWAVQGQRWGFFVGYVQVG